MVYVAKAHVVMGAVLLPFFKRQRHLPVRTETNAVIHGIDADAALLPINAHLHKAIVHLRLQSVHHRIFHNKLDTKLGNILLLQFSSETAIS